MGFTSRASYKKMMTIRAGVCAAVGATMALSGCSGGGTPINTTFGGAYSGRWEVPTSAVESGYITFTVDTKGWLTGTMRSATYDQNTNTYPGVTDPATGRPGISLIEGQISNAGDFHINFHRGSVAYTATGKISHQQVFLPDPTGTPTKNQDGSITPVKDTAQTGVAGDFRETLNGTETSGTLYVSGGTTTTGG